LFPNAAASPRTFLLKEKFTRIQPIRRAALSVHLNIAEGCSRKSFIKKRLFEISRGSVKDTAFDIACL